MYRTTKAVMLHRFEFTYDEIEHLGIESHQFDFMETIAREDLRKSGLESIGGEVKVDFGYRTRNTVLTIAI